MMSFIILFGFGLIIAMTYNSMADKNEASSKLKRIQKELARREALEKEQAENKDTQ